MPRTSCAHTCRRAASEPVAGYLLVHRPPGPARPDSLPGRRAGLVPVPVPGAADSVPHGTTIVARGLPGRVVLAGDRRATAGNLIATRDIQKVFITDDYSAVGIAGTAGIAVEMVRLFTVELEHYEKIERVPLTLDGKVSRLAAMVRGNLGAALRAWPPSRCSSGTTPTRPIPRRADGSSPSTSPATATRSSAATRPSGRPRFSRSRRARSFTAATSPPTRHRRSRWRPLRRRRRRFGDGGPRHRAQDLPDCGDRRSRRCRAVAEAIAAAATAIIASRERRYAADAGAGSRR